MTDVPTLAILLVSIAIYAAALEKDRKGLSYLGGISLCLAVFASYQVMVFVPLVFIYALMKKRLNIHIILSLSIPILALSTWLLTVYALYDSFPLIKSSLESTVGSISGQMMRGLALKIIILKIVIILAFVGSSMMFLLPTYHIIRGSLRKFSAGLSATALLCFPVIFKLAGYSFYENLFLSVFVALGIQTLYTAIQANLKSENRSRGIFLLLWMLTVLGYCIFVLAFGAARYLLPMLVPIVLVIVNGAEWDFSNRRNRVIISCAVSLSVLFGAASAYSDYRYADTYRDFAGEIKTFRSKKGGSFDIWYIGVWGTPYYMRKANSKPLTYYSDDPRKGDFIVVPVVQMFWKPSKPLRRRMQQYAEIRYESKFPLRLFNRLSHAGFYCQDFGLLPFSVSQEPNEIFLIFEVISD
jgi:hypothetical protein